MSAPTSHLSGILKSAKTGVPLAQEFLSDGLVSLKCCGEEDPNPVTVRKLRVLINLKSDVTLGGEKLRLR